jgi:hypothetical protein
MKKDIILNTTKWIWSKDFLIMKYLLLVLANHMPESINFTKVKIIKVICFANMKQKVMSFLYIIITKKEKN